MCFLAVNDLTVKFTTGIQSPRRIYSNIGYFRDISLSSGRFRCQIVDSKGQAHSFSNSVLKQQAGVQMNSEICFSCCNHSPLFIQVIRRSLPNAFRLD